MTDRLDRLKQFVSNSESTDNQILLKIGYNGPIKCAETACKYFTGNKENLLVVDVCAGIGLTAKELNKRGFKIFDGFDNIGWMLQKAEETRLYRNLHSCKTTPRSALPYAEYDLAVACGACERLPPEFVGEMITLVRPGGIVCIVNRRATVYERLNYPETFFPLCDMLENEGKWTKQEISTFKNFLGDEDGIAIVYRVN